MKGTDNVFDTDLPVLSHLTYNEMHTVIVGVLVGASSRHGMEVGFTTRFAVVLVNIAIVAVMLGAGVSRQTKLTTLIRGESWYYLAGLVAGYGAMVIL